MTQVCDGCGAAGAALRKVSLGHDFFGAVYDRLTPSSDRAPAWYCPACSAAKQMQLDCRAIASALDAERGATVLSDPALRQRAISRMREIVAALAKGESRFLSVEQARAILARLEKG